MLKVEGKSPGTLFRRLLEHGEPYREVVDALVYGLLFESKMAADDKVHVVRQGRSGAGSWEVRPASGGLLAFRPRNGNEVWVYDAAYRGNVIAKLVNGSQGRRYARAMA